MEAKNKKKICLTSQEIEARLVTAGVQPTLQRIALAKYVICEADHPTAEQVKEWAEKNLAKISLATVYNTLHILVESKLIRAFRFPHSEKVIYDCNTEDHFHFLDEKTGEVHDIHMNDVNLKLEIPKKFKMKSMDLVIKGEIKN